MNARLPAPLWVRPAEWLAMTLLVLGLITTFAYYARFVQGQAELAAIKTTLGALRTALVVEHLKQQVQAQPNAVVRTTLNPFDVVGQPPGNYIGTVRREQSATVQVGVWVFAPECPCVGYLPQNQGWLDTPSGDPWMWFEVTGMPGVAQLKPKEKYLWHSELVD